MFTHQQYIDLTRFCTSPKNFSIINIDTTFNLGEFYVTYLSYRNLSLFKKRSKMHPTFFGPVMVHLNKDFGTYLRFAQEIYLYDLKNEKKLKNIKVIVTDDDEALHSAFKNVFNSTNFMLCCNHLKKDIAKKLGQLKFDEKNKTAVLDFIFGSPNERSLSLIGSKNENDYINRTNELVELIQNSNENFGDDLNNYLVKLKLSKIFNNFCKIKWKIKQSTNINDYYTTNDIESLNCKLKSLSEKRKMNLTQIFDFFESLATDQINQSNLAVRCSGDYDVSDFYVRFKVQPNVWFNFSSEVQENKLKLFLKKNVFASESLLNITKAVKENNKEKKKKTPKKKPITKTKTKIVEAKDNEEETVLL